VSEEIEIIIMEGGQRGWSPRRQRWLTGFVSR
jgi:hypothetical protein